MMITHQWENRVLIIQTNDTKNNLYENQLKELKEYEKDLTERKLIIYQLKEMEFKIGLGNIDDWKKIEIKDLRNIQEDLNSGFEVILIGLDGSIKLRKSTILSARELFSIIDAMPMRIQELENMNKKKNE